MYGSMFDALCVCVFCKVWLDVCAKYGWVIRCVYASCAQQLQHRMLTCCMLVFVFVHTRMHYIYSLARVI